MEIEAGVGRETPKGPAVEFVEDYDWSGSVGFGHLEGKRLLTVGVAETIRERQSECATS